MADWLYYCEYDNAKTGTRFTIELYQSIETTAGTHPVIDTSDANRKKLPYGTLSIQNIEGSNHDTRIGLSDSCKATVDIDFNTLKSLDFYEDFMDVIMFPNKNFSNGVIIPELRFKVDITEPSGGTNIPVYQKIGTTWRIYEQQKLIGQDMLGDKQLIFLGQHTVGLEGEFSFSTNQISIEIENIVSVALKRMNFREVLFNYDRQTTTPVATPAITEYMTTQLFYNYTEPPGTGTLPIEKNRKILMYSVMNQRTNNDILTPIGDEPYVRVDNSMIILWKLDDLLAYIELWITATVYAITRYYGYSDWNKSTVQNGLNGLIARSYPLYRQTYDNTGALPNSISGIRLTSFYILAKIKASNPSDVPPYIIYEADILFKDGKYKYLFDFISDLLAGFCVFGNFTNYGIAIATLKSSSSSQALDINLDTDAVEYSLNFGISKYSNLNVSNLEYYKEDIKEKERNNNFTESNSSLNIMTVFHNQPPNNSDGWKFVNYCSKPIYSSGGTPTSSSNGELYNWGYLGSLQPDTNVTGIYDILKRGNKLGEKFVLNLFYLEKDPSTTERSIADRYILVHNGVPSDSEGALNINYINNPDPIGRTLEISESIKSIQDSGCLHNTIADYVQGNFVDNVNQYPFCIMTLKIPTQVLNQFIFKFVQGDAEGYAKLTKRFFDDLLNSTVDFLFKTQYNIGTKALIKESWQYYSFAYNVSEGYYEIILHQS